MKRSIKSFFVVNFLLITSVLSALISMLYFIKGIQTDREIQQKWLGPLKTPQIDFAIMTGERVQAAYEYCNIHQLWKG